MRALARVAATTARVSARNTVRGILVQNKVHQHFPLSAKQLHTSAVRADSGSGGFLNILEDDSIPIRVSNASKDEIVLTDGLVLPPNCLFLNGHIFTWNTPVVKAMEAMPNGRGWESWTDDIFTIFEVVSPRPEILILGTGATVLPVPPRIRSRLNSLGIQIDVQSMVCC